MKKIFLLAAAFVFTMTAFAQPKPDDVVKVASEKHDFGKLKQGVPVTYSFELKNKEAGRTIYAKYISA